MYSRGTSRAILLIDAHELQRVIQTQGQVLSPFFAQAEAMDMFCKRLEDKLRPLFSPSPDQIIWASREVFHLPPGTPGHELPATFILSFRQAKFGEHLSEARTCFVKCPCCHSETALKLDTALHTEMAVRLCQIAYAAKGPDPVNLVVVLAKGAEIISALSEVQKANIGVILLGSEPVALMNATTGLFYNVLGLFTENTSADRMPQTVSNAEEVKGGPKARLQLPGPQPVSVDL